MLTNKIAAAFAVVAMGAALSATPAAASPADGLVGAANMVNAKAYDSMVNIAMAVNNERGNAGMFCAVFITNGLAAPGSCP